LRLAQDRQASPQFSENGVSAETHEKDTRMVTIRRLLSLGLALLCLWLMTAYATVGGELMSRDELSEYLGVPRRTLDDWALRRVGPQFARIGRFVRYRRSDVDAWVESNLVDRALPTPRRRRKSA
jgi:excisionase family DNA binding protein